MMFAINAPSRMLIPLIAAGMLLLAAGQAAAVEAAKTPANPSGRNVLIIGHSLTHCLRALEPLAAMTGHPAHKQSLYTILGAAIANDAEDTSHFGTIVLTGEPAIVPQ